MGFGYVFIGYLMAFILEMTVVGLGVSGAAALLGYCAMFLGLCTLSLYKNDFKIALWSLIPLMLTAIYDIVRSLSAFFAFDLGVLGSQAVTMGMKWATFVLLMFFQITLLYGIRMLADSVELKLISVKAVRNAAFVGLYVVLYVVAECMMTDGDAIKYLALSMNILQLVYVVMNLLLLANCAKDICPAGEEDQPFKRSRFAIINKIGDTYERNQQRAVERTMQEAEERLRRRQEQRNKKKIHHNKKRKK